MDEVETAMSNVKCELFMDEYHQLAKISGEALDGLKPILENQFSWVTYYVPLHTKNLIST